nr:Mth938-like domain-containing protein [Frigidibacter sp. ROC022]
MTEIDFGGALPVDGYGPGFFRIGGQVHEGALALDPGGLRAWAGWDDRAFRDIDVLLVGTGAEISYPPRAFREALEGLGIGVEFMASPAACRSYNMLLAEGRRVGLAVLPV